MTYPETAKTTEEPPSPAPVNPEIAQLVRHPHHQGARLRRPLPLWARVVVLVVGWIVLLVGVAGLVLPGIQGVITILAGAAILSVASEMAHRWMHKILHQRWPKVWDRVERFRDKIHDWVHRRVHRE